MIRVITLMLKEVKRAEDASCLVLHPQPVRNDFIFKTVYDSIDSKYTVKTFSSFSSSLFNSFAFS